MLTTNQQKEKQIALKALKEFEKEANSFPGILGVGLTQRKRKKRIYFAVKVYISTKKQYSKVKHRRDIPENLPVNYPIGSKNVYKVPTIIEEVGQIELVSI